MFYDEQNSVNTDYYNAYKRSSYPYDHRRGYLVLILKILLIILLIGLLFVGYLFVTNRANIVLKESKRIEQSAQYLSSQPKVVTKKIERREMSLSQEEISRVVQLVVSKMYDEEEEQVADDELYTRELLSEDVDGLFDTLQDVDLDKLNTKQVAEQGVALKSTNHYNKIVINQPKDERYTNDILAQLSNKLSLAIGNDLADINSSNYTEEIAKEIKVRSNEMRIIIVQRGDTLSKISKRAYGDYDSYIKIFEANPEVIQNPNQIFVGQRLRIPL